MHCPSCQFDNPAGVKFCIECGASLKNQCSACGVENLPQTKFCGECGAPLGSKAKGRERRGKTGKRRNGATGKGIKTYNQSPTPNPQPPVSYTPRHLAERILAEREAMEARGAPDGERKTITALFVDIKDSMALLEALDPEDARSIVDPALQLMMEAVHRYEGYVSQSTGDGIFAFFGAPIAHEDHPQRALYAALRMQEEIGKYADTLRLAGRPPLQIRVGVNTGEVVLRSIRKDDLHADYTPIGHSTGLAQRMESLAKAGSIMVSEHTHKLTEGYFEFKALGAAQVKGVSGPVNIYELLGVGPLRTRLQVATRRGLVRFVGRQSELEQMRRALDLTKEGHGQIVGVMGEAGVGKSRLLYEFKLLSQRGCLVLETLSISHGKAYPYLPLIDLLKNYFQLGIQDDDRQRREKITGRVLTLDRSLEDILPYLFFLLGWFLTVFVYTRWEPAPGAAQPGERMLRLASGIILALGLAVSTNVKHGLRDLATGRAAAYDRALTGRYQDARELRARGGGHLVVPAIEPWPSSYYENDVLEDPEAPQNRCLARYFELETIRLGSSRDAGREPVPSEASDF